MMISLSEAGKRFNRDWIFRKLSYTFQPNTAYAITGPNGSGKSTLLQVLAGSMMASEGSIRWNFQDNRECVPEQVYREVSYCAPYLDLVEEMTLNEFLSFHESFKPFLPGLSAKLIIELLKLEKSAHKQIRYYSSGMKQRVKLAQCILSNSAIVLLDEPCTNLDKEGIRLYQELIQQYTRNRLVVVSSNDEVEYGFCSTQIDIMAYKQG